MEFGRWLNGTNAAANVVRQKVQAGAKSWGLTWATLAVGSGVALLGGLVLIAFSPNRSGQFVAGNVEADGAVFIEDVVGDGAPNLRKARVHYIFREPRQSDKGRVGRITTLERFNCMTSATKVEYSRSYSEREQLIRQGAELGTWTIQYSPKVGASILRIACSKPADLELKHRIPPNDLRRYTIEAWNAN